MKKCASCTKDLPDAALHCVFCGAKQPPAPAPQQMAKTVMGYDASAQIEQLRQQANQARPQGGPPGGNPMGGPPMGGNPMGGNPMGGPPGGNPMGGPPMGGNPMGGPPGGNPMGGPPMGGNPMGGNPMGGPPMGGPGSSSQAATMFASGPPPGVSQGGMNQPMGGRPPMGGPMGGGPPMGGPMGPPMGGGPMGGPPMGGNPMGGPPMGGPMGGPPMGSGPMGGPPMGGPMGGPPMGGNSMGGMQPQMGGPQMGGIAPIQQYQHTHGYAGTATAGRPVEPWKDTLRLLMMVFGGILLAAFLIPTSISPELGFMWKAISSGSTPQKLEALMLVSIGGLALALSFMPMQTAARGLIAGTLGVAGLVVPVLTQPSFDWKSLVGVIGIVTLVPGLLLRHQYREDMTARLLVTVGAIAVLLPYVIPVNGAVPLVEMFKRLGDNMSIGAIFSLAMVVLAVLSLLAWMPSPSSGGSFIFAWIWIVLFGVLILVSVLEGPGGLGDKIKGATNMTLIGWGPPVAYIGLAGYGLASAIAKKLE